MSDRKDGENRTDSGRSLQRLVTDTPAVRSPKLIVAGGVTLLVALVLTLGILWAPYSYYVTEAEQSFDEPNYHYEELSPTTQDLFRRALDSEEHVQSFDRAPEVDNYKGGQIYVVEYRQEQYLFSATDTRDGFHLMGAFLLGTAGAYMVGHGSGRFH